MAVFQDTKATRKIFSLNKRIRAVAGGTAASKTISILVWLIDYAQGHQNKVLTVVSESYPHLEGGAIRDFKNILTQNGYWEGLCWNESKHIYTFHTGTRLEFKSIDKSAAHGPRRDVLFLNEANNIDYTTADQLITRTREVVWMDWNPSSEYWFYSEMKDKRDDIDFITLTYLDNDALDANTRKEIEAHRDNKNWWKVYGLGELGELEGMIYKGWQFLDDVPSEASVLRSGLDFGYTNDPSAIVDIHKWNDAFIFDEVAYAKGLSNKQIADIFLHRGYNPLIIGDSAEPKSIDELKAYGLPILPCTKGPGSVNRGIQYVQAQKCYVTKRSVNLIKEYRNYLWLADKDGKILNEEDPRCANHCMSAIRYALDSLRPNEASIIKRMENRFQVNESRFHSESTK